MADTNDRVLRVGNTPYAFKMPHPAPRTDAHHLANALAVEQHLNNLPVVTTQTIHWSLPALVADGTDHVLGSVVLSAGTNKMHFVATITAAASDITAAGFTFTPVPLVAAADVVAPQFVPASTTFWSLDATMIFHVDASTVLTVAGNVTCATTTDTVDYVGTILTDPVSTA